MSIRLLLLCFVLTFPLQVLSAEASAPSATVWLNQHPDLPQRTGPFADAQRHHIFSGGRRDGEIKPEIADALSNVILLQKTHSSFNAPPRLVFELDLEDVAGGLTIDLQVLKTQFGTPRMSLLWDDRELVEVDTQVVWGDDPVLDEHVIAVPKELTQDGVHWLMVADTFIETDAHPRLWGHTTAITTLGLTPGQGGAVTVESSEIVASSASRNVPPQVNVEAAYWRADTHQNFEFFGENPDNVAALHWLDRASYSLPDYAREAGSLLVYVKNTTDYPVHLHDIFLDGLRVQDARQSGQIVWHRVQPRVLQPGAVSEVAMRFDRLPEQESIAVRVTTTDETGITCEVPIEPDRIRLAQIAGWTTQNKVSFTLERMRGDDAEIESVFLDGQEVTARTELFDGALYHDLAFGVIDTVAPLNSDEHHVLRVQTADGLTTAAQFKAMDPTFLVTGCGSLDYFVEFKDQLHLDARLPTGSTPSLREDMLASARDAGLKVIESILHVHGRDTLDGRLRILSAGEAARDPALAAFFLSDEPDARDLSSGHAAGYIAQHLVVEHNRVGRLAPRVPTTLITDTTNIPWNLLTYGLIPDVFSPDCYTTLWLKADPYYTFEHMSAAAYASNPRPMISILEAHVRGPEVRRITAGEIKLNAYYALAAGAKGIGYWAYGSGADYMQGIELDQMAWINGQCKQAEAVLATGYPVDNIDFDGDQLWGRSVVSPGTGMVILVVNRDYSYTPDAFEYRPQQDVVLRVDLPSWWKEVEVFRVEENQLVSMAALLDGDSLTITLPVLDIGEMLLVRPKDSSVPQ